MHDENPEVRKEAAEVMALAPRKKPAPEAIATANKHARKRPDASKLRDRK